MGYETHGLDTQEVVYFYEQDFYVLSNFSSFRIMWRGLDFDTSEHAYHWTKFVETWNFEEHDDETHSSVLSHIKHARSAHESFKAAELHRDKLDYEKWKAMRVDVMQGIIRQKASQHEYVRRKLLATGDRLLVEDSWRDSFWGWGPNKDGENVLGKLWMDVRDEIRDGL